ncbi:zinc finger, CCHC-type containing protein [Tanacetum coccineum]
MGCHPRSALFLLTESQARLDPEFIGPWGSKFNRSGEGVIIFLYVDDMLIFGTDQNQVDKTKKFLSSKFSMKDMGEADVILDCFPVSTPMDLVEKLKPNTGKPVDQLEYSRAIGCLMYAMTSTRPDIAYAVGRLSRFTSNPSRQHWQAITRVFKYLKGTMSYDLSYMGYPSVLEGYSDASWINHVNDSSSMIGWVFCLGRMPFHGLPRSEHASRFYYGIEFS